MATTWFYTNENGKRVSVTGGQLKWLAKNGKITPATMVENENGKSATAGKVRGLTFIEPASSDEPAIFSFLCPNCKATLQAKKRSIGKTKQCPTCGESFAVPTAVESAQPVESESYRLASPQSEPSPFTDSMPVVAKPTDNPFTASMSTASLTVPQSVSMPVARENVNSFFDKTANLEVLRRFGISVLAVCILYVIIVGISNFGGSGRSSGGGGFPAGSGSSRTPPATIDITAFVLLTDAERAEVKAFCKEVGMSVEALVENTGMIFDDGSTMLHLAAGAKGNVAITKFLISCGANVNARNENGFTPLHYAALFHKTDIYDYLVSKGANRHAVDREGNTPAAFRRR